MRIKGLLFTCLVAVCITSSVCLAGDRDEIKAAVARHSKGAVVTKVNMAENWAGCTWRMGENSAGEALLQKTGDRWKVIDFGGGVLPYDQLKKRGVPQRLWKKLFPSDAKFR